jgi:phosphoserine phosphatase
MPTRAALLLVLLTGAILSGCAGLRADPLPSWTDGPAKAALTGFVERTTTPTSPDHIPPAQRIAVVDNDGTLWAEQPMYTQFLFVVDRVKQMAPDHPEWTTTEPFRSVLAGDLAGALNAGKDARAAMLLATHANITADEFDRIARTWLAEARHPTTNRPFTEMVYQPMLEALDYLADHGYTTFIVSGGGVEFMRAFAEDTYGIPPQRIIGSRLAAELRESDTGPVIWKLPAVEFVDDAGGKPVGIHQHIGRRPVIAIGNSDGDLDMLRWTDAGDLPSLCILIRHTDAQREWAYDRDSRIGHLDAALDEAALRNWLVIDMAHDWNRIFPWSTPTHPPLAGAP